MPALREAWGYRGRRSEFDAGTWHAYEVLQACDLLSLGLCLADLERPADGEPIDVTATLAQLKAVPGPRLLTSVPTAAGGPYAVIEVAPTQPLRVELDPYPFDRPEVEVRIPIRELEDRSYASEDEAAAAFRAAGVRELAVTLGRRR